MKFISPEQRNNLVSFYKLAPDITDETLLALLVRDAYQLRDINHNLISIKEIFCNTDHSKEDFPFTLLFWNNAKIAIQQIKNKIGDIVLADEIFPPDMGFISVYPKPFWEKTYSLHQQWQQNHTSSDKDELILSADTQNISENKTTLSLSKPIKDPESYLDKGDTKKDWLLSDKNMREALAAIAKQTRIIRSSNVKGIYQYIPEKNELHLNTATPHFELISPDKKEIIDSDIFIVVRAIIENALLNHLKFSETQMSSLATKFGILAQRSVFMSVGNNWIGFDEISQQFEKYLGSWQITPNEAHAILNFLNKYTEIDRNHSVPGYAQFTSGTSKRVYIDQYVPISFIASTGQKVNIDLFLMMHEIVEKAILVNPPFLDYQHGHQLAERIERALVCAAGIPWDEYNLFQQAWIQCCCLIYYPEAVKKNQNEKIPIDLTMLAFDAYAKMPILESDNEEEKLEKLQDKFMAYWIYANITRRLNLPKANCVKNFEKVVAHDTSITIIEDYSLTYLTADQFVQHKKQNSNDFNHSISTGLDRYNIHTEIARTSSNEIKNTSEMTSTLPIPDQVNSVRKSLG